MERINKRKVILKRWDEAFNRLRAMFKLLSVIQFKPIHISFLNRPEKFTIERDSKITPLEFRQIMDLKLLQMYSQIPTGGTPTYERIYQATSRCIYGPALIIFLFDGAPNSSFGKNAVHKLIRSRPPSIALSFISCSGQDEDVAWLKDLDESAKNISETDDNITEIAEMLSDQGLGLPVSPGIVTACALSASWNQDIDVSNTASSSISNEFMTSEQNLDESVPINFETFSMLSGPNIHNYEIYLSKFCKRQIDLIDRCQIGSSFRIEKSLEIAYQKIFPWKSYQKYYLRQNHREIARVVKKFRKALNSLKKKDDDRQKVLEACQTENMKEIKEQIAHSYWFFNQSPFNPSVQPQYFANRVSDKPNSQKYHEKNAHFDIEYSTHLKNQMHHFLKTHHDIDVTKTIKKFVNNDSEVQLPQDYKNRIETMDWMINYGFLKFPAPSNCTEDEFKKLLRSSSFWRDVYCADPSLRCDEDMQQRVESVKSFLSSFLHCFKSSSISKDPRSRIRTPVSQLILENPPCCQRDMSGFVSDPFTHTNWRM